MTIKTDKGEDAVKRVRIRRVDCELDIHAHENHEADEGAGEEPPMQPVPFDLSLLEDDPMMAVEVVDEHGDEVKPECPGRARCRRYRSLGAQAAGCCKPRRSSESRASAAKADSSNAANAGGTPTIRVDLENIASTA